MCQKCKIKRDFQNKIGPKFGGKNYLKKIIEVKIAQS